MRFYLSKLDGSGVEDDEFRPLVSGFISGAWSAVDARSNVLSQAGWMLVQCDPTGAEHTALAAATGIKYLPFENADGDSLPLTAQVSEIDNLAPFKTFLETHHIPTDGLSGTDTIKYALKIIVRRFLIRQILKNDDMSESLDSTIGDISQAKRQRIATKLVNLGIDISVFSQSTLIRDALKSLANQNVKWLKTPYDD